MTLRPFISYYGGKWRAAPKYPAPAHERLVEPFAGGAGYSLRHPERKVELYDVDPVIVAVWQYLITVSADEILRLPLIFDHVDEINAPQEARWLIGFWLNSAVTAPRKSPSKWMRDSREGGPHASGAGAYWGESVRSRIASQLASIRHWTATQASYADIVTGEASWFVDPPYCGKAGRQYRYSEVDYRRLAEWCQALRGQVIVCEQEGADWLTFEHLARIKTTAGSRGKHYSSEVIWTNDAEPKAADVSA